ncbi:hypothetical protein BASA83_004100 [Batrachochytrium salamandrivorans]|nr:hypothetical protein BASA83_004100 [Batrachochytrium salamandrivorans]
MRVGIRIILSVLSSSVLAAVIPNNDDHGILLVRRAGNPDNKVVLWKRADEEQEGSEPSGSGASGGGSSPNLPSDNNGLGNPGKPQRNAKGSFLAAYNNQDNGPFFLSTPKSKDQSLLTQEVNALHSAAKKNAEAHLRSINAAIIRLTKNPRDLIAVIKDIVSLIARFHYSLTTIRDDTYNHLFSRIKNMNNRSHLKVTETHIHQVKDDNTLASKALKGISDRFDSSMARFKDYASSEKTTSSVEIEEA